MPEGVIEVREPPRPFLHATHLEFEHPATHAKMVFDAPLPPDLAAFLADKASVACALA